MADSLISRGLGLPQNREVMTELIGMHARSIRLLPFLDAVILSAAAYDIHPFVPRASLALWFCIALGMESLRGLYAAMIFRRRAAIDPYRAHRWFVLLAGLCGLSLGLLAVTSFATIPPLHIIFMAAILFGYAAGGIGVAASPAIETVWSLSILLPTGYAFSKITPEQAAPVWLLLICFAAFLVFVANAAKSLLVQSIVIRHQRDALVADLEKSNAEVRAALVLVEESAQTRARVLAAASHDLRQPLHALSIYSAVLAANPAPDTLREVGQSIDQIVRSLGHLLNGLLDLSRLSVGYYTPEKRAFALDKIVNDICAEFEKLAAEKNLAIVRDLAPVRVHSDPMAAARIVRNLIDNAVKYTDSGTIRIATAREGATALLSVTDTGRGIPGELHQRVFEEFYQIDNPGRDRSKGVGLGLALVQRLCELIHAQVSLASVAGEGSRFSVRFAEVLPEPTQPIGEFEHATRLPLDHKRVYVVDDESDILKSMSSLLAAWGMAAATADSPAALEALFVRDGMPDLLIVDLRLGSSEHGGQLARRMQMVHGPFPVLVMTGETSSEALREANDQNYLLLQKPIPQEALFDAIDTLLRQPA